MGNRAIITLEEHGVTHPVGLYVQWNGGLESVLAFVEYTYDQFGSADVYDYHARLCQVIGNFFEDGLSLYAHAASEADTVAACCDNGRFHFAFEKKKGLRLLSHDKNSDPEYIEKIIQQARDHNYWHGDNTILHQIAIAQPLENQAFHTAAQNLTTNALDWDGESSYVDIRKDDFDSLTAVIAKAEGRAVQ